MEPEKKTSGTIMWVVIAIIIILIGWYLWQTNMSTSPATVEEIASDLTTLEQDLNSTDTNLNLDLETID